MCFFLCIRLRIFTFCLWECVCVCARECYYVVGEPAFCVCVFAHMFGAYQYSYMRDYDVVGLPSSHTSVCVENTHTHTNVPTKRARKQKQRNRTDHNTNNFRAEILCPTCRVCVYVETLGFAIRVRAECVCTLNASIKSTYFIVQQPIKQSYIHAASTRRHVWTVAIVINQSSAACDLEAYISPCVLGRFQCDFCSVFMYSASTCSMAHIMSVCISSVYV